MFETNQRKIFGIFYSKDIYYAESLQSLDKKYDLVNYRHSSLKLEPCKEFHTLYIDLTPSEEDMLNSFSRNHKRYIRQMARRKDLEIQIIEQPTQLELEKFATHYNKFAMLKNISRCPKQFLNNLAALGKLIIIKAIMFEETLAQFAFITDEERVVVHCGCTARLFYYSDPKMFSMIKYAHLYMDYQAMLYFKNRNIKIFDFCGLDVEKGEVLTGGVNQYKLGFGGKKVVEYHFMVSYTLKGQLLCRLKNWRDKLKTFNYLNKAYEHIVLSRNLL